MDATSDEDTWYDVRVIADDEDVTVYRAERDKGDEMVEVLSAAAEYEYTPYGDTYLAHGSDQAFRYTGKPRESRTGLYYFPYRFYNPTTARWLTRDPLGMVNGPNVYAYVGGNPTNWSDPTGALGCYASALYAIYRYGGSNPFQLHCLASCVLTRDCLLGGFEAFTAGLIKEMLDILFYGREDTKEDLEANIVGISIGRSQRGECTDSDREDCAMRCNRRYPPWKSPE